MRLQSSFSFLQGSLRSKYQQVKQIFKWKLLKEKGDDDECGNLRR